MSVKGRIYGEKVDPATGELIARLDDAGRELPFGDPISVSVGIAKVDDTLATVRRLVHSEFLRQRADAEGVDTPEEADDFDLPDDPLDPLTPYEEHFMPQDVPAKEVKDGDSPVVKGRSGSGDTGSRKPGEVDEGQPESEPNAPDTGGVPKADKRGGVAKE